MVELPWPMGSEGSKEVGCEEEGRRRGWNGQEVGAAALRRELLPRAALHQQAYLKNGVPQNNLKKTSLLAKAACKITGQNINVALIQSVVLGCNMHCPGQWLQTLLYPRI